MEDKLKKFVEDHRAEFEVEQAPDFVWQQIEKELQNKNSHSKLKTNNAKFFKLALKIAAVFVLFFFMAGVWKQTQKSSETLFAQKYPELVEVEQHYEAMIEVKMIEVKHYKNENNLSNEVLLNNEMLELKTIYKELKGELKGNIENKKIINAMIQNYRMRLEILETLLEQLNTLEKDANLSKDDEKYTL